MIKPMALPHSHYQVYLWCQSTGRWTCVSGPGQGQQWAVACAWMVGGAWRTQVLMSKPLSHWRTSDHQWAHSCLRSPPQSVHRSRPGGIAPDDKRLYCYISQILYFSTDAFLFTLTFKIYCLTQLNWKRNNFIFLDSKQVKNFNKTKIFDK